VSLKELVASPEGLSLVQRCHGLEGRTPYALLEKL